MAKSYKIFPSIGIARIGDSESDYYLAPDAPQRDFVPTGGYRDRQNKIKRMGQTFRIYEYEGNTPVREITKAEATIVWDVELCNSKPAKPGLNEGIPRDNLICKARGVVRATGGHAALRGTIKPTGSPITIKLGDIFTNEAGRLIVLGGHGLAKSWTTPPTYPGAIQSSGFWDDTSDGRVSALVQLNGSSDVINAEPARVIVGVADFAHANEAIVTIYDLVRDLSTSGLPAGPVSFTHEIFPVLQRAVLMQWVSGDARSGHAEGRGNFLSPSMFPLMHDKSAPDGQRTRKAIFEKLRRPGGGGGNMPDLSGDLTLTNLQYEAFKRWANNDYNDDWNRAWDPQNPPQPAFKDIPIQDQPDALNRAAMGSGIGGSFYPGIEAGVRMAKRDAYERPFHVSRVVETGGITHDLGIPWQADFKFCGESWWPSGRPGSVALRSGEFKDWTRGVQDSREMVDKWSKLGFIVREGTSAPPRYVETERTLPEGFTLEESVTAVSEAIKLEGLL